jgi:dipeptidyl aminopeptidase/acylaminoacyl peptidase
MSAASSGLLAGTLEPFGVVDSIEMKVLADPDILYTNIQELEVKVSENGRWFFVITKSGNVSSGCNDYELLVYDVNTVRRNIDEPTLPQPRTLAKFSSSSNRPGIARARWMQDGETIAFIAEGPENVPQVFIGNARTGALLQLTQHPSPILDFDLDLTSRRVIYLAEKPVDWADRYARGYVVGSETPFTDLMGKGFYSLFPRGAYYIMENDRTAAQPVEIEPYTVLEPYGMWLSPGGRWAVVLEHVQDAPASWWADYSPIAEHPRLTDMEKFGARNFSVDHPSVFLRYTLVDMRTGAHRALVDAPTGKIFAGSALRAHWIDESTVLVANTFLPLRGFVGGELARRRAHAAIVEVNVETLTLQRVADIVTSSKEMQTTDVSGNYLGSTLTGGNDLVVISKNAWIADAQRSMFRKQNGQWRRSSAVDRSKNDRAPPLQVTVKQGLNESPNVLATDLTTHRSKTVTDFNPGFARRSLGKAEVLHWKDAFGRRWSGTLLKPPNHIPGKRYPLVIYAARFTPMGFWVDGPPGIASGFAARALANRDIVVLQMGNETSGGASAGYRDELEALMPGYEAVINELAATGLIDKNRVGIQGFSRTGFYVQHALVFSRIKFAAAYVSDPSSLGLWMYVNFYGLSFPGMVSFERLIGAPLWGDENIKLWVERDPTFHLDRIRIPLRIEVYEQGLGWWDVYAILRRHNRPVEYVSFPGGAHGLVKPWERLTSQGGAVDWFDFWLNGHEDPAKAKETQYARWRTLRDQHNRLTSTSKLDQQYDNHPSPVPSFSQ